MVTARRKPEEVQAVQWQSGVEVPDLTELRTEFHYSEGREWYYVSRPGERANHWMSVAPVAGEPPDEEKAKTGGFFGPAISVFRTPDGRKYWRKVLAFATTKVRTGPVEAFDEGELLAKGGPEADMFLDYGSLERWKSEKSAALAVLHRGTGHAKSVNGGDWIVTDAAGGRRILTDAEFRAQFDVVD